jgi:hypothetical protein
LIVSTLNNQEQALQKENNDQVEDSQKSGFRLLDTGIVIAISTATVYVVYDLYLFGYFQRCGVSLVDLHYSLQDALAFNPWVVMFIFLFILFGAYLWLSDPPKERIRFGLIPHNRQPLFCVAVMAVILVIGSTFYWLGRNEGGVWLASGNHMVIITCDDKAISGYSYLCRSADTYYFFKTDGNVYQTQIFTVRADKIQELSFVNKGT